MLIRPEREADRKVVYTVNAAAFETEAEAKLVDVLRADADPIVSLVAEEQGQIVGHIMFSPVTLSGDPQLSMMGLAPLAVTPQYQRKGIGSALVRAGLEQCKQLGAVAVVVLGHPNYYPRFGFVPSSRFAIDYEYEVPEEVFMAMELHPAVLRGKTGKVTFHVMRPSRMYNAFFPRSFEGYKLTSKLSQEFIE